MYTQSVNITASGATATNPSFIMPLVSQVSTTTKEPQLKELMKEKDVKELDPPSVFISYAHNDKTYFDIFIQYLQTHSGWKIWTDRNIEIGSDWFAAIQASIKESDIAVLLISANFISSGFIKEHEYYQFSSLQSTKPGFKFLPILLRDVDFTRWEDLAAMQLFVAYGDEYGVPEKRGVMIPFAKLCRFDNNGQLIPNDNIDTYFKNLVKKAEKDWLKNK
ncbi:MAG: toll/interleukin-1 receptor domain-containing protein [Chitinophagaceae bacterium]|nr:toll/interleukin-1 receptor domain-containing protein [Chitinophagaceae bacterium]